eukprot:2570021-Karenia_brevis.AAC.1
MDYIHVRLTCSRPPLHWFLESGATVSDDFVCFPTFTRPIPKAKMPNFVAGLSSSSASAVQRYVENCHRFQPYHYEDFVM